MIDYIFIIENFNVFSRGGSNCSKFKKSNRTKVFGSCSKVEPSFIKIKPNRTLIKCSNIKIIRTQKNNVQSQRVINKILDILNLHTYKFVVRFKNLKSFYYF